MEIKILHQLIRQKPLIELPNTPSPLTRLKMWVLMIWMCVIQLRHGVKNTPRYCRDITGMIIVVFPSPRCTLIVVGGVPQRVLVLNWGRKNIASHLSASIVKPQSHSQEKTQLAAVVSLLAVVLQVGPEAKMLPSLTQRVRLESSQDSARQRMGPVTSADRIGDSRDPCGVPRSGFSGSVM